MATTKTKIYVATGTIATLSAMALAWYLLVWYHPSGIHAPIAEMDVPFTNVSFKAEDGLVLHYETGSVITIPPHSLVDGKGNPITGEVTASYREFHTAYDIFRAGIPMGNMAEGRALMSGGMFEIEVQQDGEALRLAPNHKAAVSLAAYRPTEGYEVFGFDGDDAWQENGWPKLDINQAKLTGLAALAPLPPKPIDPRTTDEDIVIDLDADYNANPDLQYFKNTRWRLVPEENLGFEDSLWAFRVLWNHMKVVKHDPARNLYKLHMKQTQETYKGSRIKREFAVIVTPVLEGDDLEASLVQFKTLMQQYDSVAVYIIQERDRLDAQADVLNSFDIASFGVHNIDKIMRDNLMVSVKATFNFTEQVNPYFNNIRVYFLNHDLNTVQDYGLADWDYVFVQPGSNTTLIAVLPGERVAVLDGKDFAKLPLQNYKGSRKPFRFEMVIMPQEQLSPIMGLTASR